MLDINKLPQTPENKKAVWWHGNLRFGMFHCSSQSQAYLNPRSLEANHPEIVEMLRSKGSSLQLPEGWKIEVDCRSEDYYVANFVGYRLVFPHQLKIMQRGSGIPIEIGYLIAGNLQLGESFTFRNFKNYLNGRNLKYLPLVITPESFVFNVYFPTKERVARAIEVFKQVLCSLEAMNHHLPSLVEEVYALVRLDEVCSMSKNISSASEDIGKRVRERLDPFSKKFGYVFKEMEGPQDVTEFYYEMLAEDRKE